jgi:hypothetical protein
MYRKKPTTRGRHVERTRRTTTVFRMPTYPPFRIIVANDGDCWATVVLPKQRQEVRQILALSDDWRLGRHFFEECALLCAYGTPPVLVHGEHRASGLTYLLASHPDAHFMAIAPLCHETDAVLRGLRSPVTWANAGKWKILRRMEQSGACPRARAFRPYSSTEYQKEEDQ